MAKKSSIEKNERRKRLVSKYASLRGELKAVMAKAKSADEFYGAQRELCRLPRNSSPIRVRNRCSITGRCRAYMRKFGVSRLVFRELVSHGKLPGVVKSSW
jgi:small subunit ribosomal protein S14